MFLLLIERLKLSILALHGSKIGHTIINPGLHPKCLSGLRFLVWGSNQIVSRSWVLQGMETFEFHIYGSVCIDAIGDFFKPIWFGGSSIETVFLPQIMLP